jgi:hypothetical protein
MQNMQLPTIPIGMDTASAAGLFEIGPLGRVLGKLTRIVSADRALAHRAIALALIAWVPLVALSLAQDGFRYGAATASLLADFGVHARYLLALPLLVLADRICGARLSAIARYFFDGGMVADVDRPHFAAVIASTRRACESRWAAAAIIACTYVALVALLEFIPRDEIAFWHQLGPPRSLSPAGWWHLLVSAPLLLALFLSWLWRLIVWTCFLWQMARSPIRLCAAHPDQAAGLKFVGYSVRAFAPVGAALGALLAGRIANHVWHSGAKLESYQYLAGGLIVGVLILFGAPVLVFTSRLMQEWRDGVFTYGKLAEQLGFLFEDKWFRAEQRIDPSVLAASDFSAAIDLSTYVSNVYNIRLTPADLKSFIVLAVATATPLLPVVLIAAPFDVLIKDIASVLF